MATIDDVMSWANSLPAWQSDAVRRLLTAGEQLLSDQDYSEILALAKADLKLAPPPENLKPVPPIVGKCSGYEPHRSQSNCFRLMTSETSI